MNRSRKEIGVLSTWERVVLDKNDFGYIWVFRMHDDNRKFEQATAPDQDAVPHKIEGTWYWTWGAGYAD